MQNILYFSYQALRECDGVSKKILSQVDGIRQNGYQVFLLYPVINRKSVVEYRYNDRCLVRIIQKPVFAFMGYLFLYLHVLIQVDASDIKYLYVRYNVNANSLMSFFLLYLKRKGVKIFLEIPTYPYDAEQNHFNKYLKYRVLRERFWREKFKKSVWRIVTTSSDYSSIWGIETVRISNAVDPNSIPLAENQESVKYKFVGVANLAFWHGYDRMVKSIGKYYSDGGKQDILFCIVGDGDPSVHEQINCYISEYGLENHVHMLGSLSGSKLDIIFEGANLGVGCLGCYRKGVGELKSLKNVEYAMRGLPIVYSETNADFDNRPYVYKVSDDNSEIDIDGLLKFIDGNSMSGAQIRESVYDLTWKCQMEKVFKSVG